MPHKCNTCAEIFPDGCEEILEGCTSCGGKKFEYVPERENQKEEPQNEPILNPEKTVSENESQKEARSSMVDKADLPETTSEGSELKNDLNTVDSSHDIESILNNQFEGITVVEKGKYELNISKIFDGESKIIKIQDDGKYVVNIPETFKEL